jgi:hypothetical protein
MEENTKIQTQENEPSNELSIEEYSIVELEDRLEFVLRCDNRCHP